LKADLARVRDRGFAESEGEAIEETHGMAVPIFAASGGILASIGISAPTYRAQGEDRTHLIRMLLDAGRRITQALKALETR
jgi:DNA-binding IclR family transcriptional regulator